jgi:hypothetical protein
MTRYPFFMFTVQASQITVGAARFHIKTIMWFYLKNIYLIRDFSSADYSFIHDGYDTLMIQFHQITNDFIVEVLDLYKRKYISVIESFLPSGVCRRVRSPPPPPPSPPRKSAPCTTGFRSSRIKCGRRATNLQLSAAEIGATKVRQSLSY